MVRTQPTRITFIRPNLRSREADFKVARIHSHRHGKSHQTRPSSKSVPGWVESDPATIRNAILKLAKDGQTPSRIGIALRDDYGVPLTRAVLGKPVLQVLSEGKASPKLPQDLQDLIDRAQRVQKHLQTHRSDRKNVHSLELVEAKIYRLAKYYKQKGVLPNDFKYTAVVAQLA
jgi:small subunit ribosomal protein S15